MSYATDFLGHLKSLNLTKFTLADIINQTMTSYPASVLQDIKRILGLENKHLEETLINNKGRKEFTIAEDRVNEKSK